MKQYEVRLAQTETQIRSVLIWAENEGDAEAHAMDAYGAGEYAHIEGIPDREEFPTLGAWSCVDNMVEAEVMKEVSDGMA